MAKIYNVKTEEDEFKLFKELESMTREIIDKYSLITEDLTRIEIEGIITKYYLFFNFGNEILIDRKGLKLLIEYVKETLRVERAGFIEVYNLDSSFYENDLNKK